MTNTNQNNDSIRAKRVNRDRGVVVLENGESVYARDIIAAKVKNLYATRKIEFAVDTDHPVEPKATIILDPAEEFVIDFDPRKNRYQLNVLSVIEKLIQLKQFGLIDYEIITRNDIKRTDKSNTQAVKHRVLSKLIGGNSRIDNSEKQIETESDQKDNKQNKAKKSKE